MSKKSIISPSLSLDTYLNECRHRPVRRRPVDKYVPLPEHNDVIEGAVWIDASQMENMVDAATS